MAVWLAECSGTSEAGVRNNKTRISKFKMILERFTVILTIRTVDKTEQAEQSMAMLHLEFKCCTGVPNGANRKSHPQPPPNTHEHTWKTREGEKG